MSLKVFVAGGTGVLGRAGLRALVEAGHSVRSKARGEEKAQLAQRLGAEPIEIDLYNPEAVRRAVAGSDAILRLTIKFGPLIKLRDRRTWNETMRLRTLGARILVDAAIAEGVPTYVHESVTFLYRDGGSDWLTEDSPTDDGAVALLRATLEGEQQAVRFSNLGGRGVVLRFSAFYGTDAPSTLETVALARRRMLFQFGAGANYFSSIHVPDAGHRVLAALDLPPATYNVCDDHPVTSPEYPRILTTSMQAPKPFHLPGILGKWVLGDAWKYFSRSQRVSNARIKQVSDWRPAVKSVSEGWPLIASELARHG